MEVSRQGMKSLQSVVLEDSQIGLIGTTSKTECHTVGILSDARSCKVGGIWASSQHASKSAQNRAITKPPRDRASVAENTACCRSDTGASSETWIVLIPCGPRRRIGTDMFKEVVVVEHRRRRGTKQCLKVNC